MSDYIPTTKQVRAAWNALTEAENERYRERWVGPVTKEESNAEFDRWLSAHDADLRERITTEIEGLAKSSPYAGQFNEAVFSAADTARGKDPA